MTGDRPEALSPADAAKLARLVAKYGRRLVVSATQKIRPTRRSGHPFNDDKRAEMWEHIEWIDQRADNYRSEGKRHGAVKRAETDRFLMVTPRDKWNDAAELRKFRRRVKKFRDEWSKVERAHKAARARQRVRIQRHKPVP